MEWSGRFEPNRLSSTRGARHESAVKTVRFAAFIYPLSRKRWAEPNGIQPIRIQDACSGVRYIGGAFLEARPKVSGIMRNGALWECLLSVSGRSYKDFSPW